VPNVAAGRRARRRISRGRLIFLHASWRSRRRELAVAALPLAGALAGQHPYGRCSSDGRALLVVLLFESPSITFLAPQPSILPILSFTVHEILRPDGGLQYGMWPPHCGVCAVHRIAPKLPGRPPSQTVSSQRVLRSCEARCGFLPHLAHCSILIAAPRRTAEPRARATGSTSSVLAVRAGRLLSCGCRLSHVDFIVSGLY